MPSRQRGQRPQPAWTSTATRSPIANSSTAGPSFTTVPMYSWPGREALVERQFAVDHRRHAVADDLDVGGADRDRIDPHQHLRRSRLRHRLLDQGQLLRLAEHPGLHRVAESGIRCVALRSFDTFAPDRVDCRWRLSIGIEPDIGQILADEVARRDAPALQPRRGHDDAVPPQQRNRVGLGQSVPLEIADDLGALPLDRSSSPDR